MLIRNVISIRGVLFAVLCAVSAGAHAVSNYNVTPITGLSEVTALNDSGVVVGQIAGSQTSDGWPHAARWVNGSVTDLGMFGCRWTVSHCWSKAFDINAAGAIVGESFTANSFQQNPYCAFFGCQPWGIYYAHETKWENGSMNFVKAVGWEYGTLTAINTSGDMAGHGRSTFWADPNVSGDYIVHGYFLSGGVVNEIGSYGQYSKAFAVNDNDQVTGEIRHGGINQAFLWQAGSYSPLGHLGGNMSVGMDINDATSPMIVGNSKTSSGAAMGFVWQNGQMTALAPVGGAGSSSAAGVNNAGHIVGASAGSAILWQAGQAYDLNSLTNGSYGLAAAIDINENGQIVAEGSGGFYLLTPVP